MSLAPHSRRATLRGGDDDSQLDEMVASAVAVSAGDASRKKNRGGKKSRRPSDGVSLSRRSTLMHGGTSRAPSRHPTLKDEETKGLDDFMTSLGGQGVPRLSE